MSEPDDDFLSRWSARKLRARGQPDIAPGAAPGADPAPLPEAEPSAPVPAAIPSAQVPPKSEAEILEELGLPDPDSLVKGDDFRAFLAAGVPAGLRARALRRLWLSDPVLANLDGLNDYDGDFTDKATARPDLKTAYRVGKGYLRQTAQPAAAAAPGPAAPSGAKAEVDEAEVVEATPDDAPDEAPLEPDGSVGAAGSDPAALAPAAETEEAAPGGAAPDGAGREAAAGEKAATMRPRRMRFRFDAG